MSDTVREGSLFDMGTLEGLIPSKQKPIRNLRGVLRFEIWFDSP